MIKSFSEN